MNHQLNIHILRRGFTLLEILIVISIIGILTTIGTVAYTSAQKQGRDSRRRTDLKAIQNGFEQYYADNSSAYPAACDTINNNTTYFPGGFPKDPKSGTLYSAQGVCSASGYYIWALLEATTTTGNATNTSCANGTGAYFCVKNLQ